MSATNLLLKYTKRYPFLVFLTIVSGFSGAIFNGVSTTLIVPIILNILGQNINLQTAPAIIQKMLSPFGSLPEKYRLIAMSSVIILSIILKNVTSYLGVLIASALSKKFTSDMREEGVNLLLEVDLDYFKNNKIGDIINKLGGEIGRTSSAINSLLKMVINVLSILIFLVVLISISWQLTIGATILLSLVAFVNQSSIVRSRSYGKLLAEMSKEYSINLLEVLSGMKLVKSVANEQEEYEKIQRLINEREKADFQSQANDAAIAPISEVTGIICLMGIVFLGKTFLANQVEALATVLLTYLVVLFRLLPFISQLNTLRSQYANTVYSVQIINEFLQRDDKPLMKNGKLPYKTLQKGIEFKNISFAYPNNKQIVLKNVSLFVGKGETLALVGASGAGKSTLADLLPRFYDPLEGDIYLDDIELKEYDIKTIRRAMGIVSQDTFLFNNTVRANLSYARPHATEIEIIEAAKRANAYEFIEKLPQGLDTFIGDRGVLLSGGQKQRLAIARALLQDPEILILDEATSALDTVSERLVQSAIEELRRDRTTLVIAHRLSTIQKADQIAVLDQGMVVEIGNHQELLAKNGYYNRLYMMQFAPQSQRTKNESRPEKLANLSYELRTLLHPILGYLALIKDGFVENAQEEYEILDTCYKSAIIILEQLKYIEENNE